MFVSQLSKSNLRPEIHDNFLVRVCLNFNEDVTEYMLGTDAENDTYLERGTAFLKTGGNDIQKIQVPLVSKEQMVKLIEKCVQMKDTM